MESLKFSYSKIILISCVFLAYFANETQKLRIWPQIIFSQSILFFQLYFNWYSNTNPLLRLMFVLISISIQKMWGKKYKRNNRFKCELFSCRLQQRGESKCVALEKICCSKIFVQIFKAMTKHLNTPKNKKYLKVDPNSKFYRFRELFIIFHLQLHVKHASLKARDVFSRFW